MSELARCFMCERPIKRVAREEVDAALLLHSRNDGSFYGWRGSDAHKDCFIEWAFNKLATMDWEEFDTVRRAALEGK